MIRSDQHSAKVGAGRIGILLLTAWVLLGQASPAQAINCSQLPNGTLDGFAGDVPPSQIQIDRNCTIRNYPNGLSTNFSFQNTQADPGPWLVVFDNVAHTGQMACDAVHENKIWFVNGSFSGIQPNCQNKLIPVEKIDKQNPAGQSTAAIGVPFTYDLVIPVLFDPATGTVIDTQGSATDLHGITVTDDLNETGVALSYLSHTVKWVGTGVDVPHTFSNVGGLLSFEFGDLGLIVPAGEQFVIAITVVLDDTPANAPGTQFVNTAKWDFGRLICDDVNDPDTCQFFEPLPGEWGISPPLTIAAPELVMTKTGPATLGLSLNLGEFGQFTLDLQNTGLSDAWDVTILDRMPDDASGGTCDLTPEILSAQVFEADGTTPVAGKGPLVQGSDYSFGYSAAPTCELTLSMLTPAAAIGPGERLIISYQTKLDADTQDGATLTNVAGAIQWFNGDSSNPGRLSFDRTLSDGTPGVADHEDEHTVSAALFGYFFEKTVEDLDSGANPALTAAPGDTLRYTLRLQATDLPLSGMSFFDDLGDLNASTVFVPGSLNVVSLPGGATDNSDPNAGTNNAGVLDIRNIDVPASSQVVVQFEIQLESTLVDGTVVTNQATLRDSVDLALSDDPNVNGQADPSVAGDEDPTQVVVEALAAPALLKENTQATAGIGEEFRYRITVPSTPHVAPLYDVRILDDLGASAADLEFVSVAKISGSGSWTPVNTGTPTNLVIEDPVDGIDIPSGEQIVVEITVRVLDTATNVAGLGFTNTAAYSYDLIDADPATERPGDPGTTVPMTLVEPELTVTKGGPASMALGTPGTFSLDVQNTGAGPAWTPTLQDLLPDGATGGMCDTAPSAVTAQVFEADGTTPVSGVLVAGTDYAVAFSGAPSCQWSLAVQTAAGTIGPGQRLIVSYEASLDADTQNGTALTNVAGATGWFSQDGGAAARRAYSEVLTDGTVGTLDHEDAHTVTAALPDYLFEKTVANLTSGVSPAITAAPGDVLRYSLRFQNTSADPLANLSFRDEIDALNGPAAFVPGSLSLVTVPAGADTSNTDPNGGASGTGLVDVRNLSLPGAGQLLLEFEVTLESTLVDGSVVSDQSELLLGGAAFAVSDDPNVNGPADPFVAGDEDPTRVLIAVPAASALLKENTQATAAIGEVFSYRITVPETPYPYPMYDVEITDDLSASAADLRFVGVSKISGSEPWVPVNSGTATSLLIEDPSIGIDIPAGEQIVLEITVVLEDTATNVAGLQFTNSADYSFDWIDGDDASRLPGAPGTTPPMTVAEPDLVVTKTGPAIMSIGTPETFVLDVQNAGDAPAWNATLQDLLPDGATGGMCDATPSIVSVQVFEADGTTPVSGVLAEGPDYSVAFAGAPSCQLDLSILTAAGTIGAGQRLIVSYQTELDADTQDGVTLTNVAGATGWFSQDSSSADRRSYSEVLTDGTVGTADHEDAHTVGVALPAYLFEKTVIDLTSGADPATTAAPGDTLRYRLRLESLSDVPLLDLRFNDELDALNSPAAFVPGSLVLVTVPAGADASNTDPSGGANGTGLLDIRGLSLAGTGSTLLIEFDVTLAANLADGSLVANQSQLLVADAPFAVSDDPNLNGPADPFVSGDEDPTQVLIQLPAVSPLLKNAGQTSASVGVPFVYQITVPELPYAFPLYDVRIVDDLAASGADLVFVGVTKVAGSGSWTPVNTGTGTSLVIEDPTTGIDIPAGEQIVVEITVVLADTPTNVAGLSFTNTADYSYNRIDEDDASQLPGAPGSSETITIVEPELTLEKSGPAQMTPGTPDTFSLDVHNIGGSPAWELTVTDRLPNGATGGTCDVAPSSFTARVFQADGVTPVSAPLTEGSDFDVSWSGDPVCSFTLSVLTASGSIGPDERLIVSYQTELDAGSQNGVILINVAGATEWFSADASVAGRRTYTRTLSDGTPGVLDHEDAFSVEVLTNVPSIFAAKDVALLVDNGTPNVVDPLDVLRYTITITNSGGVAATGVTLTDGVPANTSYVTDSLTLNGVQILGAGSPLVGGLPISSADLTPPLPGAGLGTLSPGATAVIQFDLQVDAGTPGGTVISNQAVVGSLELPGVLSDGDGNPATGPEPTIVIVGAGQQLLIVKQVQVVGGGPALPGSTLEYTVTVTNIALVPALDVVITDDLTGIPLSYVDPSATLDGGIGGVNVAGSLISADYGAAYGPLAPNASTVLVFRAVLDPGLNAGDTVTNTGVVTWDTPQQTASASVSIDVGGVVGVAALNGAVWHDADFDDLQGGSETPLQGWTVGVYQNGTLLQSVLTDAAGAYSITNLAPNDAGGVPYEIRFSAPGAGANTASLGTAASAFTNGPQQIGAIVAGSGSNLQALNLPIDPNGVVYDALLRTPVAGAMLRLLSGGAQVSDTCFDDAAQQGQVTLAQGWYKFELNFSGADCPASGADYIIEVTPPGAAFPSQILPPSSDATTPALSVPTCPGGVNDALPLPAGFCEAQASAAAPAGGDPTPYYLHLTLDASRVPGSGQIFNNHVPVDPVLSGALAITKTTPSANVVQGQIVPYEITVSHELGVSVPDVTIVDRYPAGFSYVEGSARIDGLPVEPVDTGNRELLWSGLTLPATGRTRLVVLLAVGAGVTEGKYVNRAQALSSVVGDSGEATATVRIVPDPTFSCTDVIGKVFDDANRNGVQDPGEPGLPGVRLATTRGLAAITDQYGRYHITCAAIPNESRGSNFALKLDDRTLPSGYRMSTRQLQVQRATRGKALRLDYAASIHRVVGLDLADAVFEPGSVEMRLQWTPRLDLLLEELAKAPSTLRLSYVADLEDPDLVDERLAAVKRQIGDSWKAQGDYELEIETEVFWRLGGPPAAGAGR